MQLNLSRPIIFFDLETTGIDPLKDRVVEISLIKVYPDGTREGKTRRINPQMHIPEGASAVHGITDEHVKECPTFANIARSLVQWLEGCDLGGFNSNKFDVPVLAEEFSRAGVEYDLTKVRLVDVQNIFHRMEQRTLAAAYKFYCGKQIENAHSAEADVEATYEVLLAQLDKYEELENNIDFLSIFSQMNRNVDLSGRVILNQDNVAVFNFGKHKGQPVEVIFRREPSYYDWIMKGDFAQNTKDVVSQIKIKMAKDGEVKK